MNYAMIDIDRHTDRQTHKLTPAHTQIIYLDRRTAKTTHT